MTWQKDLDEAAKEYFKRFHGDEEYEGWECDEFISGANFAKEYWVEKTNILTAEIKRLEDYCQRDFHQRVCLQSRGCYCKEIHNEALAKWAEMTKEEM